MSLYKFGSQLKILKTAASVEELVMNKPLEEKVPGTKIIEPKHSDFLYYRARAISAGDQGPIGKDGKRSWNYNGNFDFFARKQLEASYETFVGRNIFLDHNSESSLYSVGKLIDAVPVDDPETGEFYIEIVGKIDRTLHPEICRKIETGELNSTSMGCSVDDSMCSICGNVLHSDGDDKCIHMGMNLGKKFPAEIDLPEFNIHKGEMVPCFSINSGIVFNEDSIVGVPADPTAVIKTVLSNMKSRLTKKASLSKEEQLDLAGQMEKLFAKLDDTMKLSLKAEFCGICPPVEKESSMADKNVTPNEDQKKILSKLSALEMEQLESYVAHKTKKANEIINKEVVADAASKEETFLSKIVAKVKNSFAAELLEKKIETVAKEEMNKIVYPTCESGHPYRKSDCVYCKQIPIGQMQKDQMPLIRPSEPFGEKISAKFQEDKNNVLDSTWSVNEGDKCVLEASLKDIWGNTFETLSFDDQKWATSEEYAKEAVARYKKEGIEKLADLWDVTHKLSKTAGEPKLGPSGPRATPTTGLSNKKHDYPTTPKFTDSKPGADQKGPAAPAHKDIKVDYKINMPGQEKGQTGPAAPKPMDVKTDYNEPKPEAEGKEVKTTPNNPNEKEHDKSEKEVKTDYVAEGTEAMEAEEKGKKEEKSEKKASSDAVLKVLHLLQEKGIETDLASPNLVADIAYRNNIPLTSEEVVSISDSYNKKASIKKAKEIMCKNPKHGKPCPANCPACLDECAEYNKKASINYKQANAQIKWSALSGEAQDFIKKHVEKHMKEDGMERAQAVAAAYSEARKKGFEVPSKASSQEIDMKKQASDKPVESVDGSTLPEGKKKFDAKPEEAVKGTTLPGGAAPTKAPETSAQGDKEHKTPNLTKAPDEAVDGTTLPPQGKKDEESVETSTHPDSKKSVGTEPDSAVNKTAAVVPCKDCGKSYNPESGEWCENCLAKHLNKNAPVTNTKPSPMPEMKMSAATEMPTPEMHEEVKVEEKPEHEVENLSLYDAPKGEEVSAFDATEKLDVGDGYSAHKDHESKEVIIEKDGKEVKRLPDGFGKEVGEVLKLMKAVLGLPAEETKPAMSPDIMAPKVEEHPALEEAHEDELGIKESALKVKEAELIKKEAVLKAKEDATAKEESTKKFAAILQTRSERCRKIVAELVEKEQLSYDKNVYESELQNGAHLLDARKKAFEASITSKMKEFMSLNDSSLDVMEATVKSLQAPVSQVTKKANRLFVSPQYNEQVSEEEEIKKIFNTMGNSKLRPQ